MSPPEDQPDRLRTLFAFGLTDAFYSASTEEVAALMKALDSAFSDLAARFDVTVIGGFDDDRLQVGASASWPWTALILADAPSIEAVIEVCNLVRQTPVLEDRMWKYIKVEARVGRPLFFGRS